MVISGLVTAFMIGVGAIGVQSAEPNCDNLDFGQCLGSIFGSAIGEALALVFIILLVFLLLVGIVWFLTGMLAGWQVVRHVRRLEPGITGRQGWGVSFGWGCGALVAATITLMIIVVISNAIGL
jgi:hypothetical protein